MDQNEVILDGIEGKKDRDNFKLSPEEMLEEVVTGQKISITRTEPNWSDTGWLETIMVSDQEPVSLRLVEKKWGGGSYLFRFLGDKGTYKKSFNVEIAGTPRNKNGALAKNPDIPQEKSSSQRVEEMMMGMMSMFRQMQPAPAPVQAPTQPDVDTMWKLLSTASERHIATLQNIVDKSLVGKIGGTEKPPQFDIGHLVESVQQIKELTSLFQPTAREEDDGMLGADTLGFFQQIMNLVDKKDQKQEKQPEQAPVSLESMAGAFRKLDSEERAALVGAALSEMDEEEKEIAFQFANENDTPSEHTNEPEENHENTTE